MLKTALNTVIFIVAGLTFSCGGAETDYSKKEKVTRTSKDPTVSLSDDFDLLLCKCLDSNKIDTCLIQLNPTKTIAHNKLLANDCYRRAKYEPIAQKICDCVNAIDQASLDCDEMQRVHDKLYKDDEKEIIQSFFSQLSCGDQ